MGKTVEYLWEKLLNIYGKEMLNIYGKEMLNIYGKELLNIYGKMFQTNDPAPSIINLEEMGNLQDVIYR